jgi:26S proteasome regulatory subunit T5
VLLSLLQPRAALTPHCSLPAGTTRRDSELSGDREVQRTMLELLNQLDGFTATDEVKIIAATNRPDTLDPALLRSGE